MYYDYLCPACRGHLRIGDKLVIAARTGENEYGLIFLHPELGDYTTEHHSSFRLREGDELTIYCPVCHNVMNFEDNKKLAKVLMRNKKGEEFEIFFSGIAGEKCTYRLRDKEVRAFGPDMERYQKYFDLPKEYRKYL
jgi:uncharacterized protein YbaR (Trm112 family)